MRELVIVAAAMESIEHDVPLVPVAICGAQCAPIKLDVHRLINRAEIPYHGGNGAFPEYPVLCKEITNVSILGGKSPRNVVRIHDGVEDDIVQGLLRCKLSTVLRPFVDKWVRCFGRFVHGIFEWLAAFFLQVHKLLAVFCPVRPLRAVLPLDRHPWNRGHRLWVL